MRKVKVSSKGQLVIPQEMRNSLGIKEGNEVFIEMTETSIMIHPKADDVLKKIMEFARNNPAKITREEIKVARKEWKRG